jgi:hypothetical protein
MTRLHSRSLRHVSAVALCGLMAFAQAALAAETLHVYGTGGPAPAMKEAAAAFGKSTGVEVEVTAGPTPAWLDKAKGNADLVYSGSETMMTDFIQALGDQLAQQRVTPLYLRPPAKIAHRVCRHLTRRGWLEGEDATACLSDSAGSDDGLDGLRMSSITYRIATGLQAV